MAQPNRAGAPAGATPVFVSAAVADERGAAFRTVPASQQPPSARPTTIAPHSLAAALAGAAAAAGGAEDDYAYGYPSGSPGSSRSNQQSDASEDESETILLPMSGDVPRTRAPTATRVPPLVVDSPGGLAVDVTSDVGTIAKRDSIRLAAPVEPPTGPQPPGSAGEDSSTVGGNLSAREDPSGGKAGWFANLFGRVGSNNNLAGMQGNGVDAGPSVRRRRRVQPPASEPHALITPMFDADPPVYDWQVQQDPGTPHPIPPAMDQAFIPMQYPASRNVAVCVTVPFYTEPGYTFRRGLEALALQREDMQRFARLKGKPENRLPDLHVFAIADGWKRNGKEIMSATMKAEMAAAFGPTLNMDEVAHWLEVGPPPGTPESVTNGRSGTAACVLVQFVCEIGGRNYVAPIEVDCSVALATDARTTVLNGVATEAAADAEERTQLERRKAEARARRSGASTADIAAADEATAAALVGATAASAASPHRKIFLTLLIKRDNAKKHHSHRWFFEAFAPLTRRRSGDRMKYYFATDCGTLYAPSMLVELIEHMDEAEDCAACCGHQRIMTFSDQSDPSLSKAETWSERFLRDVQAFDFESGLCVFNGVHSAMGFLPVIPGPCGLFRADAITDGMLREVREICTNPITKDGIVQGNLKIAEDRILSYLLLLVPGERGKQWETHWVPSTVFYFESEETLREFVLQRRRWLNGTTAGYIWLLQHPLLWKGMLRGRFMPFAIFALSLMQLLVFFVVFLMPAFLSLTGHLALYGLSTILILADLPCPWQLMEALDILYWVAYLGTFYWHIYEARWGSENFNHYSWTARYVLNCCIMFLNVCVMVSMFMLSIADRGEALANEIGADNLQDIHLAFCFSVLYTGTPFFLTLLHSFESFTLMVKTFPSYYIFLPTILADFFAYSCSRYDDLSWGTKEVAKQGPSSAASGTAAAAVGTTTARALTVHVELPPREDTATYLRTREDRDARQRLATTTNIISIAQLMMVTTLILVNIALDVVIKHYLIAVGSVLAASGLTVMICSFAYFVYRAIVGPGAYLERGMKLLDFLGWCASAGAFGWMVLLRLSPTSYGINEGTDTLFTILLAAFFMTLGALLGMAAVRGLYESFRESSQTGVKLAQQEAVAARDMASRAAGNRTESSHKGHLRKPLGKRGMACAMMCSCGCMPLAPIILLLLMPLNAVKRTFTFIVRAISRFIKHCCCPSPASVQLTDDDDDDWEIDEDGPRDRSNTGEPGMEFLMDAAAPPPSAASLPMAQFTGYRTLRDNSGSGSTGSAPITISSGAHRVNTAPAMRAAQLRAHAGMDSSLASSLASSMADTPTESLPVQRARRDSERLPLLPQ